MSEHEDLDKLNERISEVCKKEEQVFVEDMTEHICNAINNNDGSVLSGMEVQPDEISFAIQEAIERNRMYQLMNNRKAKLYYEKYGIDPMMCENLVCSDCKNGYCDAGDSPIGCMYRMTSSPPNDLNYDEEYMPSHREALDMLEKHDLIKGSRQEYLEANAQFGKAESCSERESTEVKGITMAHIGYCVKEALETYIHSIKEHWNDNTDYSGIDVDVVARNTNVNVEKAMGIYPNIRGLL